MGINIELWRVRIGTFNPGIKKRLKFHGICLSRGTFSVAVRLCILLIIGGVEQNPGPPKGPPIRGGSCQIYLTQELGPRVSLP